jgi:NitT/TauT family transport system substrate-binding protein
MDRAMTRRAALSVAVGALVLSPVTTIFAADLPFLHVSIVPIFVVAPHIVADRMGYFAAEGISVTTQPVQGGHIGIPGLVSGSFDVLYSNSVSVLTALERGIDLRIIAEGTRIPAKPPDPAALVQRKGGGLHTGKDVEGKIIGINVRFDIQWLIAQGWIKQTGGDPSKVIYREVPLPSMLDALQNRQIDAAVLVDPFLAIGLGDPNFELLDWAQSKVMPAMPSSLWVVSGAGVEAKPDLLRAYMRGFRKGTDWVNEHLGDPEYLQLVASFTKTDEKLLAKMALNPQPYDIDIAGLQRLIALMRANDLLKTDVNVGSRVFQ